MAENDYLTLNGTTLLLEGPAAGKSVSEFTSGLKVGRATYDDRQHAFYNVFDDFSGGFGYRKLDIREALGTHWDNEGGVDLRRARHITLPPARYTLAPDNEPSQMLLSSEILDGAACAVPTESSSESDYFYYGAGDTVYRLDEDRDALTRVQQFLYSGGAGIVTGSADNEPEKMTRMFLFRGAANTRRLYAVTANGNAAGSSSKMLYTEDPGVASPTWVEGVRAAWDAIPLNLGPGENSIVIGQAITFEFMFSADPKDGATDWNIDGATAPDNNPIWIPHSICRFLGQAAPPTFAGTGVYFIDYGNGKLYFFDWDAKLATPVNIGEFHYLVNGIVWQGNIVVTDGWDIWLYMPGGGSSVETVRKIGLWGRDGVPDSLRAGNYRITGLVDGGDQLFAIAERTTSAKATTATLGFVVFVYNGAGWSTYIDKTEAVGTSTTLAVNPISAVIDRYPTGVHVAANMQKETSRSLNILCQMHPTTTVKIRLHTVRWPKMGKIPIDTVDEFDADPNIDHKFKTGWIDGGFNDLYGALFYMKVDLQSTGGAGGSVKIEYRLDDDESAAFTTLGTVSDFDTPAGAAVLQFDDTNKAGVEFRTVQFQITIQRAPQSTLSSGINDSVTSIPVAELSDYPAFGIVMIEDEAVTYTGGGGASGAGNLTGATRGARGTTAASHSSGQGVNSQNRSPELRGLTLVYSKKAKLRKTWTVMVDVDRMVEAKTLIDVNDDGTPTDAATHQNVLDFLETLWDKKTLVKLVLPEMEPTGDNVRVEIADVLKIQDDNRETGTTRGRINLVLIEPVRA